MQNIGEKIEEARKRKGISIREASEATKIRSDFLSNIEKNIYEYDLPEIYKKGFIKNYARYLKLDPDQILSQYQEQLIEHSLNKKKGNSELFGKSLELPKNQEGTKSPSADRPSLGTISIEPKQEELEMEEPNEPDPKTNKDVYIKSTLVGVGTIFAILVVIWIINLAIGMGTKESSNYGQGVSNIEKSNTPIPVKAEDEGFLISEITIKAIDDVFIYVLEKMSGEILFNKVMSKGEVITLKRQGPVDIASTSAENFVAISNNKEYQPSGQGLCNITIP